MRPNCFDVAAYRWRGPYPPRGECSPCRAPVELLRAGAALARQWLKRGRERAELARLDATMRRDIGVTPSEVEREIKKPFWRA